MPVTVADHPLLEAAWGALRWPKPLGELVTPATIGARLSRGCVAPALADSARLAVRDLLRATGFKPSGRKKPASEYLVGAAAEGRLTSINVAVDLCNAVSLHGGLPISVVDLQRSVGPHRLLACEKGTTYVFNSSGQFLDLGGLLALWDAEGPCAGPVKDSQRTKTDEGTVVVGVVVWGSVKLPGHAGRLWRQYVETAALLGAVEETW